MIPRLREQTIGCGRGEWAQAAPPGHLPTGSRLRRAGVPVRAVEPALGYINGTTTATGLRVTGVLKRGGNETGERVSNADMQALHLIHHAVCPQWSYTLHPRRAEYQ